MKRPLLSICIPTYNRCARIYALVCAILKINGAFEICVYVDGSTDGTILRLETIEDERLRIFYSQNKGRASAIGGLIQQSRGKFVMLFDDDDELYIEGLMVILADCNAPMKEGCSGFIYHMDDDEGHISGEPFRSQHSNFLALRADEGVTGDKKEVVLAELAKACSTDFVGKYRRVPTSLLWSRLALSTDIACRELSVGSKLYMPAGMTNNIKKLKRDNAFPMVKLYATHILGYFQRRYQSIPFFLKAIAGLFYYSMFTVVRLFSKW